MTVDIHEPLAEICDRIGIPHRYVYRLEVNRKDVVVHAFTDKDGVFLGEKGIDPDTGEPFNVTLTMPVRT